MSFESVDVQINDSTPRALPLGGVVVKVLSQDGKILWTVANTDSSGHVGFLLPSGATYQVRFFKASYAFTNPQYLVVNPGGSPPNLFTVLGVGVTPPIPNDARLCTAYGFFRNMAGRPACNVQIQFISQFNPLLVDGAPVLTERVYVTTDAKGYAQVDLFQGGKYDVTVSGTEDYLREIAVPFLPNINMGDLLFPVVSAVTFTPAIPPTLHVGDPDFQVTPTAYSSDGNVLPANGSLDIQWSSSDPTILAVLPAGGVLSLRPLSAGTAQVIATRNNQSIIVIPNLPIQGSPTSVVVS